MNPDEEDVSRNPNRASVPKMGQKEITKKTLLAYQLATVKSNQIKLVVMGPEGAGKTSSVQLLMDKQFNNNETSTVEASINCCLTEPSVSKWQQILLANQLNKFSKLRKRVSKSILSQEEGEELCSSTSLAKEVFRDLVTAHVQECVNAKEVSNGDVRIVILDLGGQQMYYEVHFLFLAPKIDIVLLTFDASKGLDQPVVIYQQRLNRFQEKVDHLPQLVDAFHFIENKFRNPEVFKGVKQVILKAAKNSIVQECPISYLLFETILLQVSEDNSIISLQEAQDITTAPGIEHGKLSKVLCYYSCKGVILLYPDVAALQQEVFMHPQKNIDLFVSIIYTHNCQPSSAYLNNSCTRYDTYGLLEEHLLNDLLKSGGCLQQKEAILALLQKFKLAVEVSLNTKFFNEDSGFNPPSNDRVFVVPSMLEFHEENIYQRQADDIVVLFHYPDKFLLESIFNHLLVRSIIWSNKESHHICRIQQGYCYFNFKSRNQSFKLQKCQTTSSIKCYITILRKGESKEEQLMMLKQRQALIVYLKKCIIEVHELYAPAVSHPIAYIECPLWHEERCDPHVRLENISETEKVYCSKNGMVVPSQACIMLLTANSELDEIITISNSAKEGYIEMWSKCDGEPWLLYYPKLFSEVVVIMQHAKASCYEPLKENMTMKGIEAITATFERHENHACTRVLIKGAPGIGKTVLMKQIAYRWSKKMALQKFRLVIFIQLRDPNIHKITKLVHLLQSFAPRSTKAAEIASACIQNNDGKDIAFLFDGFDELPESLQKNGLVVDIIKRKILPRSAVMVSSRPCASAILLHQVTTTIEILGFTTDGVKSYIETAMENQPQQIDNLTQYMISQPVISTLCTMPFNLAILVDVYKHRKSLPKNHTELYSHFVCITICRHLTKFGKKCSISKLTDLPDPYYRIIWQLSKLAYHSLENSKCFFTLDEVKAASPSINGLDDAYGLLQAQHFNKSVTFNFLHFTIQEYLAGVYLSTCSSSELELTVLKEKFWSNVYSNMFTFYMGLTKGQRPSFKKFLSDKKAFPTTFINDELKCFRLFRCFYEADCSEVCNSLKQSQPFASQTIDLSHTALSADDVMSATFFLVMSDIEWGEVNLCNCGIQDHGVHILFQALCTSKKVQISTLQLNRNCLTVASSSMISDIILNCNVKKLWINGNHFVGESQMLLSMLSNYSTALEHLYMVDIKLSSNAAKGIFLALMHNKTLKELVITDNNITEDACNTITKALRHNSSLVKLWMWNNPICTEALLSILKDLQTNNALTLLGLPYCSKKSREIIQSLQQIINKKRVSRGCEVKLMIDFM